MASASSTTSDENRNNHPIENFDDILIHIGSTGRYQKFLGFVLLPFCSGLAFLFFGQVFIALVPEEHWCRVPEFEDSNLTDWQKIELSVPPISKEVKGIERRVAYSRCQMYITNYTEVLITKQKPGPDTPIADCQYGWSFNMTSVPYISIGAELEWVCDKAYLITTAQSIFFVGSMVGGMIYGYIADHFGRLPALFACNGIGFIASVGTAFTNSFWSFTLCRFITGFAFDNCLNILFIIIMEYVEPKYRTVMGTLSFGIYFATASSLLPWVAYWISNWQIASIAYGLPLTIGFISPWIIPESARWYIQKGRIEDAVKVLKRFAKVNKKEVPDEIFEEFKRGCNKMINEDTSHNNYTVLDLFKLPRLRRFTITLVGYWILLIFIFDGHIWSMKLLYPDVFISFTLAAVTELPAAILIAMFLNRWGRRWMGFLSMLMCGLFSFAALAIPIDAYAMSMATIARLGVNIGTNIGYQYATEILPTVVRAQGVSLIHIIGYTAHVVGPYIVNLANIHASLPLILLGFLSFIVATLTLTLPETTTKKLPETLEEGNDFGKEQSFWWFPCFSSSPEKKKEYRNNIGIVNSGFNPDTLYSIELT